MRREYVAPRIEVIAVASQTLLAGSYGGKVSSREFGFEDDDDE